jgi:predicted dehydrogenase
MDKVYRVALVGCGAIHKNHINGILAAGHTVCALCDIEEARAQDAASLLEGARVYTDYETMLDAEQPDAVHICTPHYLHAKMSIAALGRGINVLCEKPLCINRTELERVMAAAEASSAQIGVCHQNRYEPYFLELKKRAGENPAGALGVVAWNRDADYYASGEWRGKWLTEGGGVMINQALHTLDLLQWIGGEPVCVTAHIANDHLKNEIEVEDTATALFETADGRRLNLFATTACGANFPAQLHVKSQDGRRLYADTKLLTENGESIRVENGDGEQIGKAVWGRGHALLIGDFYRCVATGEHFPIDAAEGAKVIRLILSMYESNGKRTDVY